MRGCSYHCWYDSVTYVDLFVVIATEEKVQGHWCKRLGEDEATGERTVCLPHLQVCRMVAMVTDLGY